MYKVVKDFTDLKDNNHVYLAGDEFPRKGAKVDDARVTELSTTENKRGEILIEPVQSQKETEEILKETEETVGEGQDQSVEEKPKRAKKKK